MKRHAFFAAFAGLLLIAAAALANAAEEKPPAEKSSRQPFFAMDNGVGRGKWTPAQQAQTVKELGYDGMAYNYTTPEALLAWQRELHQRGLKLYAFYTHSHPDLPEAQRYQPGLQEAIRSLKGSETIVWLTLLGTKDKKKSGYDDVCVEIVRQVSDWARASGLKVVIYPHAGFYVANAEEALRIVERVDRPDVGLTVNLCHELMQHNGPRLPEIVRRVGPRVMLATINGADNDGKPHGYIQRLDQGTYDVAGFLRLLKSAGYHGPVGLQSYSIKGDVRENLEKSMAAWRRMKD